MGIIIAGLLGLVAGVIVNRIADYLVATRSLPDNQHFLRAPIICVLSALAFAFLDYRFGPTVQLGLAAMYSVIFLIVLVTDIEHRLIFDIVILPATLCAAILSPFSQPGWKLSVFGGAIALVIVLGIHLLAEIFTRIRGIHIHGGAFGQGDVKLATFMGTVVAFPNVLPAILYTILLGGVGAISFLAFQLAVNRRVALTAAIPYGPFFCIAGWACMVFR
jgi:leader peptidase (prepilin peptidase) / N-methyltransferase